MASATLIRKRENRSLIGRLMDLWTAITGVAAFGAGVATDWLRQWSATSWARRHIRAAIGAEIQTIIVTLNFYVLAALRQPDRQVELAARYFSGAQPEAFTYYWSEKRDDLLKLPEWPVLKNWH